MRILGLFLSILLLVYNFEVTECLREDSLASDNNLIRITEDNWSQILEGEWMVEFYAPWCPACRNLEPIWRDFASWAATLDTKVAQVDVTENPGLSGRFIVTALPTIYHVKDGEFRQYRGSRSEKEFTSFVEERKWKSIDPISYWKHPASIQMSLVSHIFRISMVLRNVHTILMEEYGLPYWGSYLVFGLATLILGSLLGLILICIIDCLFPSKKAQSDEKSVINGKTDEDLVNSDVDLPHEGDGDYIRPKTANTVKKRPVRTAD